MRLLRFSPLSLLAVAILSVSSAIAQQASTAVRITSPIDEHQLVTLKGTVHALANARNDRGAAPDETQLDRVHLVLKRSPAQEAALQKLIADMHTPGTASYHKWLTPESFGKQFGPADQDIATVETWLTQHGFAVSKVLPGKQVIEFSGNAGQFRNAFHAQIRKYEVEGQTHLANAADPQVPAALASVVGGFASLNNFHLKSYVKTLGKAHYDPKTDHAVPEWTTGDSTNGYNFVLAPQDYAVQYDLNPLYSAGTNGSGQTIAIINESNLNLSLVNSFRSLFNLPVNPPQVIIDGNDPGVDGVNNPDGPNGASVEAYLDVEWAGAVAPNATVDLVIGGDTALESGLILAAEHAVYSNLAPIMSLSFGQCESSDGSLSNAFFSQLWEQAAAQGITVLVSTGDNGSAGCDDDNTQEYALDGQAVSGLASTPYNVAVGGTDFYYSDYSSGLSAMETQIDNYWNTTPTNNTPTVSIKGVIPEQPWNDSQYGLTIATLEQGSGGALNSSSIAGGSGGSSSVYTTKPTWQTGFGDSVRDLPDVSLFASNGDNASFYPICALDGDCQAVSSSGTVQFYGVGGTSASTPAFAGIMALVNQKYGRQGQADFVLYPLSKQVPAAFHDVQNGTNTVPCETGSVNCIAVSNPGVIQDPTTGESITEGEIGVGTTAWYNAVAGYDEASGLGTIDANQLVTNWTKVKFDATSTTLTPSSTTFTHGTAVTISGNVTASGASPTGSVALMTSSPEENNQGQGLTGVLNDAGSVYPLSSGAFTGSTTTLPGGTYNIWGQYSGDSASAESSSTPVQITVSPESSGIDFQIISPSGTYGTAGQTVAGSVAYGTQLELSAQVAPTSQLATLEGCSGTCPGVSFTKPTGTIVFADGSKTINTAVINTEGDAEYNPPFSVGSHTVTAAYPGDSSYKASTAAGITFTVSQDTPNIYLGAANETNDTQLIQVIGGTGQPTIFNILIENGAQSNLSFAAPVAVAAPTGTVSVTGFPSGVPTSATLSAGVDPSTGAVAGIGIISLPASTPTGDYNVSISYSGDTNYAAVPAESGTIEIAPSGQSVSTTTATATGSISPTTSILITGTVTGSGSTAPTGAVYIYASGNFVAGANINPGSGDVSTFSVALNSQNLSQGVNYITVQYYGDNTYGPSAYQLPTPVSNPLSDFSLIALNANVPITVAGNSGTVQVTATSMRGFTGTVALTTSANSAIGIQIPASVTLTAGGTQTFNVVLTPGASLGKGTFPVKIIGTDSTGKYVHTIGVFAVVASASSTGFTVASGDSLSISHGATTGNTIPISITPSGGFTGTVDLTCAVTSTPASPTSPVTCGVSPSVSISGSGAATATLTVDSTDTTTLGAYQVSVTGKDAATGKLTSTGVENITVTGLTPTIKLAPSATAITTGDTLKIVVTLSGTAGTPTGTISLSGGSLVGPTQNATLVSGAYTYSLAPGSLLAGTDTLTIGYGGDATYGATSATTTITVTKVASSITEKLSATTILTNQTLTVTGTVTGTSATPSGTVTLSGGGYTSSAAQLSIGAYSITIPVNSLSAGTDTLKVTYSGDANYNSATDTASVTVTQFVQPTPTVTVIPASTTVDSGSSLAITGSVVYQVPAPTEPVATGTVIITAGTYTSSAITLSSTATFSGTIPADSLSAGSDTVTVTYSGDNYYSTAKGTATVTVTASAFSVSAATPSPSTIAPGASASSKITVSSTTDYAGTVTLTCALTSSPSGASDLPTCAVGGTGTVTLSSSAESGTGTVSVATTAATSSALTYPKTSGKGWAGAGGGGVLAFLLFFGIPAMRRNWRAMLGMLMLLAALGSLSACGGSGGGGGGGGNPGTTAGTYTFTVTATGNPATASAPTITFNVIVN